MYFKIRRRNVSVPEQEVLAVTLVSVLRWGAGSVTEVMDDLRYYLQRKNYPEAGRAKKIS